VPPSLYLIIETINKYYNSFVKLSIKITKCIYRGRRGYLEYGYHSACPLVGIETPQSPRPPLSPASECALPPEPNGEMGGLRGYTTHSPACKEVGESQFGRLDRKLITGNVLCLL
jgi:hypothetical protein